MTSCSLDETQSHCDLICSAPAPTLSKTTMIVLCLLSIFAFLGNSESASTSTPKPDLSSVSALIAGLREFVPSLTTIVSNEKDNAEFAAAILTNINSLDTDSKDPWTNLITILAMAVRMGYDSSNIANDVAVAKDIISHVVPIIYQTSYSITGFDGIPAILTILIVELMQKEPALIEPKDAYSIFQKLYGDGKNNLQNIFAALKAIITGLTKDLPSPPKDLFDKVMSQLEDSVDGEGNTNDILETLSSLVPAVKNYESDNKENAFIALALLLNALKPFLGNNSTIEAKLKELLDQLNKGA